MEGYKEGLFKQNRQKNSQTMTHFYQKNILSLNGTFSRQLFPLNEDNLCFV